MVSSTLFLWDNALRQHQHQHQNPEKTKLNKHQTYQDGQSDAVSFLMSSKMPQSSTILSGNHRLTRSKKKCPTHVINNAYSTKVTPETTLGFFGNRQNVVKYKSKLNPQYIQTYMKNNGNYKDTINVKQVSIPVSSHGMFNRKIFHKQITNKIK
jgi:hypothetical protein